MTLKAVRSAFVLALQSTSRIGLWPIQRHDGPRCRPQADRLAFAKVDADAKPDAWPDV